MHFSKLLVLASTAVLAVAAPSTGLKKRVKSFKFFGVNESGAEFGNTAIPGQLGKDYTWPLTYVFLYLLSCSQLINITFRTTIDTLVGKGLNIFRKSFPISKRLN
jgi:endoglucanase